MIVPTSIDKCVEAARQCVARMRAQYPDQQDFDYFIKRMLGEMLREQGYSPKAIAFTMDTIFGRS